MMYMMFCVCSAYLDHLAEEVNDKLQAAGLISIAELCKSYDLPGDFLTEVSYICAMGLVCSAFRPSPAGSCLCVCRRSCLNVWGNSFKENWTSTTEALYSLRLLWLDTKPEYRGFSVQSHGNELQTE